MHSIKLLLLAVICILTSNLSYSQNKILAGKDAAQLVKGCDKVVINDSRNTVSFIHIAPGNFIAAGENASWLRTALSLKQSENVKLYKTENDNTGSTHFRYSETYMNIPVQYGVYYVHSLEGKIVSANGEWYADINLSTKPKISSAQAYQAAVDYVHADVYQHEKEDKDNNELVILPYDGVYYLAYRCDVFASSPLSRQWYFIDANTGALIKSDNRICTDVAYGTATTQYSGTRTIVTDSISATSFRLHDATRGNGVITYAGPYGTNDYYDSDNTWDSDPVPVDCHFGAEATYDYYWNHFGQNGLDGAGFNLVAYAHDGLYVNAFWTGAEAHFGDGNGYDYMPLTDAMIVGHEFTHGVTQMHSALVYSGESGGLNEGFSDVFGQAIDWENNPSTATWFVSGHFGGTPFRNMADCKEYSCPDTYGGDYWSGYGDPHVLSGILNYWYYLLVEGGSDVNDLGNAYTVVGIGFNDATAIAYRTNAYYLTANSTYADARYYAIQSAIDLFGTCSDQVIQTTNAWYAVGVGGIFSDAVVAAFSVPSNYLCILPADVSFDNNSVNGTSFQWDFGDGGTSSDVNPVHTYTSAGVYDVTLIANGIAACGNSDTLTVPGFITATNGGGPVAASCSPSTISYCCGIGITHVQFGAIDKISNNAYEGYKDFTCSNSTTLTAGDPVPIHITTSTLNYENVRVFIDYNNDGAFNITDESVFSSDNHLLNHTGIVYTPVTATLNTPLRMRVIDDASSYPITSSCYNSQQGQAEDYTVQFVANTLPPVADFTADYTTVNVNFPISFSDLTIHAPTSWSWSFPGGTPSSSTSQNPVVSYSATGIFEVQLLASNSFGSDSILKTAYINVVNSSSMCSVVSSTELNGILFDSGGPTGDYQNNEYCSFLISPPCADTITLSFLNFNTDPYDYIYVYDGTNYYGQLLLLASGNSLPATVKATSGNMMIYWYSGYSVTGSGYGAAWSTTIFNTPAPVADFSIDDITPPLNVNAQFTDLSTNSPVAWHWDFGDGFTSTAQNPAHAFSAPGVHSVTLIAFTCTYSDTITKSLTVQEAPAYSSSPDSINVTMSCGSTTTVPIVITNSGTGDLVFTINGANDSLKVLALTYGAELYYTYPNTLAAINQYFTDYTLSTINTTDPSTLQSALAGKDVFLMTDPMYGTPSVYSGFASVLQDFVNGGGAVVFCGTYGNQTACITNTGLFDGSYYTSVSGLPVSVVNGNHPITSGVPASFYAPYFTYVMNITNGDNNPLVEYYGNDVVSYRDIGGGEAVYIGFDYYYYDQNASQIIGNTFNWLKSLSGTNWLTVSPDSAGVIPGGTITTYVTLSSENLNDGVYTTWIIVNTNDPLHPFDSIPVTLTVQGAPCPAFTSSVPDCNGTVCFTDQGLSAASWQWNFGDGNTSSDQNPCHIYSAAGTYTVKLVVCNGYGCDSITQIVSLVNVGGPIAAACSPGTSYYCCGIGITNVTFNTINHSSLDGFAGYEDFSCDYHTEVTVSNQYTMYVTTGLYWAENVRAWIDWNNDGSFTDAELVMIANNEVTNHSATFTIPVTAVANTPLRMRVGSDYSYSPIPSSCTAASYGQFEDYTVTVLLPTTTGGEAFTNSISILPNPFNTETTIVLDLESSSHVSLTCYDVIGRVAMTLADNATLSKGRHLFTFNPEEAGVYFVEMKTDGGEIVKKVLKVE